MVKFRFTALMTLSMLINPVFLMSVFCVCVVLFASGNVDLPTYIIGLSVTSAMVLWWIYFYVSNLRYGYRHIKATGRMPEMTVEYVNDFD